MKRNASWLKLASLGLLALVLVGCQAKEQTMETQALTVGQKSITVERAVTPSQQAEGLAGRTSLDFDRGMLFVYNEPMIPSFWMKGMEFPIDIVWLREGRVVDIEQGAVVDDGATRYSPQEKVDAVLELAAGGAAWNGIQVGDTVEY